MRCVVTGGNAGIGRATVAGLLLAQAEVTMICRDRARGESAQRELERETGRRPDLHLADLAHLRDVESAGKDIADRYGAVDVLINNAAILPKRRETSRDGFELQFAVNHLAYVALTNALLPALEKSGAGRVVIVASNAHRRATLDLDDLQAKRRYRAGRQYCATKLMNVLFSNALARRVRNVTVNSLHPGVIGTGLLLNYLPLGFLLRPVIGLLADEPKNGAKTSLHLALSQDVASTTGKYFQDCVETTPSSAALDAELQSKLYDRTLSILEAARTSK